MIRQKGGNLMKKHKLRWAAIVLSVVLCFFVVSPFFIQGTSAYLFGSSHICRAYFYGEKSESSEPESSEPESSEPESSEPESSVPENSDPERSENTRTGDRTNTLPLAAIMVISMMAMAALLTAAGRSKKHTNSDDA